MAPLLETMHSATFSWQSDSYLDTTVNLLASLKK